MTGAWVGGFSRVGFVTGLAQEARIAARFGGMVAAGGGTRAGARRAALELADRGATALVSFGLAGGLDPALPSGTLLVPARVLVQGDAHACVETSPALSAALGGKRGSDLLGASGVVASAEEKRRLWRATGCAALDVESGAVAEAAAERGLAFAVLRAICDPAGLDLPPAALVALSPDGGINPAAVLASVMRRPGQLPGLLRLGRAAAQARRSLRHVRPA